MNLHDLRYTQLPHLLRFIEEHLDKELCRKQVFVNGIRVYFPVPRNAEMSQHLHVSTNDGVFTKTYVYMT